MDGSTTRPHTEPSLISLAFELDLPRCWRCRRTRFCCWSFVQPARYQRGQDSSQPHFDHPSKRKRAADGGPASVPLKVAGGVAPLTILVNGMPATAQPRGNLFFQRQGPGFTRVTVIDGSGAADSVMLRLEDGATAMIAAPAVGSACSVAPCGHP